jgi:long-chain acyl-CoA synthetase
LQAIHKINLVYPSDRFLSVLPIHHTFESTAGFLLPLSLGASIAYARGLKSREITEDLRASEATIILGVPLLFEKVANGIRRAIDKLPATQRILVKSMLTMSCVSTKRLRYRAGKILFQNLREKAALNHLRLVVSGGAALAPDVAEFMDCIGVPILQGYGLTETSPVLSVNRPGEYKYNTIGPPLPEVEMSIHRPNAQGVGEIAAKGEMLTPGYFNRPEESEKLFADGWLLTGDLGWQDEDGHFHIVGRQKNMLVTPAGKNIYPEEIEMLLAASPLILEALVYNDQDPDSRRDRIACAVVPDQEYIQEHLGETGTGEIRSLLIHEVRRLCETIADYKRPKLIIVRDEEFEKTTTRKIKRFLFARTKEERFPLDESESES